MPIRALKTRFSCQACGNCCSGGVVVDLNEALAILKKYGGELHHLAKDKDFPSGFKAETSYNSERCHYMDGKRCRIYKDRPYYCREFPLEDGKVAPEADLCPQLDKRGRFRKKAVN